ncbi:DUF4129 domain-containing protein [Schaalia sp. 19OD2882]|uniref:DUF4129 domain-containing protein n=1 Tax=Schaalia sp. 19OD2882 TaxID=2794089 RepID=UPI001C1EC89B|nr:DUF4129 domain-containing protein [Schaalia sp. 19OD2882]QWW20304.1 DUF4129 domain-containing protein [Schaalia sp. 19OD2882]
MKPTGDVITPDDDQALQWVVEELQRPEYSTELNPLTRLIRAILQLFKDATDAGPTVVPPVELVLLVGFVIAAVVLVVVVVLNPIKLRHRSSSGSVFDEESVRLEDVLERLAAAQGDRAWDEVCVWAFRVVVLRLAAAGVLRDSPGLTAHEAATRSGRAVPSLAADLDRAALLFDEIRYGERAATEDEASFVVALGDKVRIQAPRIRREATSNSTTVDGRTLSADMARGAHEEAPRMRVPTP